MSTWMILAAALVLAAVVGVTLDWEHRRRRARSCSFCGTPNNHPNVTRMIAAHSVNICNQCVTLCVQTLEET
ncbi:MAG: ClpX C4-type zinc finger protein [Solirubrobacteraceae bacterium]